MNKKEISQRDEIFEELSESLSEIIGTTGAATEELFIDLEIIQEELTSIIYHIKKLNN